MPNFAYENHHGRLEDKTVCGVDEVGRGPLAGPVVACAVIIPLKFPTHLKRAIKDSKKMTAQAREELYEPLTELCCYSVASASVTEIDSLNILWASMLAMERAVNALVATIDVALIDGNRTPKLACPAVPIIGGDDRSLSIAAASIIAKVYRDRLMKELAGEFPHYGWARNAGYGTREHIAALEAFGTTPWHRVTFAPVRARIEALWHSARDNPAAPEDAV